MAIKAKLVRGEVYYLRDERFEKGMEKTISAEDKAHLEEHAVDSVTVGSGEDATSETRQKFVFTEVSDEAEAPRRQRPAKPTE